MVISEKGYIIKVRTETAAEVPLGGQAEVPSTPTGYSAQVLRRSHFLWGGSRPSPDCSAAGNSSRVLQPEDKELTWGRGGEGTLDMSTIKRYTDL